MIQHKGFNRIAMAIAISIGISASAIAQDTSSSLRGEVTGPQGNAAANTTITIIHVPSGTKKEVQTNAEGEYFARGLRVGGPYKVIIDSDKFKDQELSNLFFNLGQAERLNISLEPDTIERITVTASSTTMSNTGTSSYFGEQAIQNNSSLSRDIKDIIRINPLVSLLSGSDSQLVIAGSNPKFNSITVDGIGQNDDFGLNGGGYPTQRSPLPLDSLEQVTVDVAPFDAKVSGFSGGLVNAVFKSGTNEFHGNVFYERQSDSLAGTPKNDGEEFPLTFSEDVFGGTLGGPIMQDKLFFFLSYEKYDSPQTPFYGPDGSGVANATIATLEEANEVIRIASDVYGFSEQQIGSFTPDLVEEDEKWVAKFDLNINDDHRASFTYQYNEGNRTRNVTSSRSELKLSSHLYNVTETLNNYSAKLYSDWTDNFSTELSVASKDVANRQATLGDSADITIDELESGGRIALGSDRYRHANVLDTEVLTFKFDGTYLYNEHSIEFGFDYQELAVANIFVPDSRGTWVFNGLENFEAQRADYFTYNNGTNNDPENASAIFDRETLALYVQDKWDINDQLSVTLGLRYENLTSDDAPVFNQDAFDRTGYRNDESLDGISILLPRIGFKYDLNDNLVLRGGVGRFSGGQPNVWIGNAFSTNGVSPVGFSIDADGENNIEVGAGDLTSVPQNALDAILAGGVSGDTNINDPDFTLPSDWRYQLALDYQFDLPNLGSDYLWTTEFLHIKRIDSAYWLDASLRESDIAGLAADGRRILYNDDDSNFDILLTNTDDGGRSNILSTVLSKSFDNGWDFSSSYTHQDITEAAPGTSSRAISNYLNTPSINPNVPDDSLGRGRFELEHRFVLNINYSAEIFAGYNTDFTLFFERKSGQPTSYLSYLDSRLARNTLTPSVTGGDFLPYIPTAGDPNVVYDGVTEAELLAAVDKAGLSQYAGGFAPKNSTQSPWSSRVDIGLTQEIPGFMQGHKGSLYFVVENFLNLIDSSQGKMASRNSTFGLYDIDSIDEQGRYVIDQVRDQTYGFDADDSVWKLKVGIRYSF